MTPATTTATATSTTTRAKVTVDRAATRTAPLPAPSGPRPLLVADWVDAVFIHFAVSPDELQPHVPIELDTRDGVAYVSLVAFTQRRLRPAFGGRILEVLSGPLATHEFLNVRTYVRVNAERGIYFLAEWIPNRLAALIGPPLYGLPYRVGRLRYARDLAAGRVRGNVAARGGRVSFAGTLAETTFDVANDGTLDAFLVERYTAWTFRNGVARRFGIRHAPWNVARARIEITRRDLLDGICGGALRRLAVAAAHVSPGTFDVQISPPQRCAGEEILQPLPTRAILRPEARSR